MKSVPTVMLGLTFMLFLGACHRQSDAEKARADYQAKVKALDQQLEQNSKNYDQRLKQLESGCGPLAPGFAAPQTPADCAKFKAQWQHDHSLDFDALHNTSPNTQPPAKPKGKE